VDTAKADTAIISVDTIVATDTAIKTVSRPDTMLITIAQRGTAKPIMAAIGDITRILIVTT
jgi:hypothetical protein